jgi:hypothetical protein
MNSNFVKDEDVKRGGAYDHGQVFAPWSGCDGSLTSEYIRQHTGSGVVFMSVAGDAADWHRGGCA